MRPGASVLAAALVLAAAAPLHADEWTLIDVKAHLANDARVTVVETHDIILESTGRNTFRTWTRRRPGDPADRADTDRTDGEPHRLKAVEAVEGPDEHATTIAGTSISRSAARRAGGRAVSLRA
jgi:hypothetical protein